MSIEVLCNVLFLPSREEAYYGSCPQEKGCKNRRDQVQDQPQVQVQVREAQDQVTLLCQAQDRL
jgi:hypothetical protein